MAEDEDLQDLEMGVNEALEQFFEPDLDKLICNYMAGKEVIKAYVTLCYILGVCIARTSESQEQAQHTMDMCGTIVAAITTARHNADVKKETGDADHTPTTRLQ